MLCAILRNTWPKSFVLVTPTRKSIRFYRGKILIFQQITTDQVEFLLQRGAKFRITKAVYDPVKRKWYVDVDLIEQKAVGALKTTIKGLDKRWERYKAPAS